jgi:hypothetical protein
LLEEAVLGGYLGGQHRLPIAPPLPALDRERGLELCGV